MEISDLELQGRYEEVFKRYVTMAPQLADVLEKFGRLRNELFALHKELNERKLPTEVDTSENDTQILTE